MIFVIAALSAAITLVFTGCTKEEEYAIVVTSSEYGSAKAAFGTVEIKSATAGSVVMLTATADPFCGFKEWVVVSGNVEILNTTSATTSFVMPNEPVEINAEFKVLTLAEMFPDEKFRLWVSENYDSDSDGALSSQEKGAIAVATDVNVESRGIFDLDGIEFFSELQTLDCSGNLIFKLNFSENRKLTELNCSNNILASLNLLKNAELTTLSCFSNDLVTLDISKNTALETLDCSRNEIEILDTSNNTKLTSLDVDKNELEALNVSANTKLEYLSCTANNLKTLLISSNEVLKELQCQRNNDLIRLDVSRCPALSDVTCGPGEPELMVIVPANTVLSDKAGEGVMRVNVYDGIESFWNVTSYGPEGGQCGVYVVEASND